MALADLIIGVESGGNPTARNPRSSAGGAGQFINATWLEMLAKHRPDIQGSREQLLALKDDPALSKAMTEAYASDNAAILAKSGLPVTPGTQYLAHFAGPSGAMKVLQSDPNAPVSSVLGASVVKANPFLARMTAGDLAAWADSKMGGGGKPPTVGQVAAAAPRGRPSSPSSINDAARQMMMQEVRQPPPSMSPQSAGPPPDIPAPSLLPFQNLALQFPKLRRPIDLSRHFAALQAPSRGLFL